MDLKKVLSIFIALSIPVLIIITALWITAHPWFIKFEYQRIEFPIDMPLAERYQLALLGLQSVLPGDEGIDLFKKAQFSDGRPAFNEREMSHMADVKKILAYVFWLASFLLIVLLLSLFIFRKTRVYPSILNGVKYGALMTIGLLSALMVAILFNFDWLFLNLHYLFFKGDTFLFDDTDTLVNIYPDQFWIDSALALGIISFLIASLCFVGARYLMNHYLKRSSPI